MSYIGLDLGTAFAKLARWPTGQARASAPEVTTVPAALTYRSSGAADIPASYSADPRPGVVRCDGFPALIGTTAPTTPVTVWQGRTPDEVTARFLSCLLNPLGSERDEDDSEPAELVVAVPPEAGERVAATADGTPGLPEILATLGLAPRRAVDAPVAALLWLRQRHQDLTMASRVVVIDAGAGSVDLSLCVVTGDALRVTDSIRLAGGSAWGTETSATAGDRPLTLAEHFVGALVATTGTRVGAAGRTASYWWRAFERALADEGARERLDAVLQLASAEPGRHASTPALRFGGLGVTAEQLLDACEPLTVHCSAALSQLLGRQEDPRWPGFGDGDGTRLLLLGGLSALYPLRAGLLAAAGLDQGRSGHGAVLPPNEDRLDAVARGAAMLAAGVADPHDRYPHELRLPVSRVVRDHVVNEYLRLAAPGSIDLYRAQSSYLTADVGAGSDEHVLVTVKPASGQPGAPLQVQLVRAGEGPVPVAVRPAEPPAPGVYQVGIQGGPAGPAVLLRPVEGGPVLVYPLAEQASR